ncbi:hypothetical protein Emag_005620 [Eimeria magna]
MEGSGKYEYLAEAQDKAKESESSLQENESEDSLGALGRISLSTSSDLDIDSLSVDVKTEGGAPPLSSALKAAGGGSTTSKLSRKQQRSGRSLVVRSIVLSLLIAGAAATVMGLRSKTRPYVERFLAYSSNRQVILRVLERFDKKILPDAFLNDPSFAADTPEAQAARASFQAWLKKAVHWQESLRPRLLSSVDTPEKMHAWEIAILRGALIFHSLPNLEAEAGVMPYDPTLSGFTSQSFSGGGLGGVSFGLQQIRDETAVKISSAARAQVRQKQEELILWLAEVQEAIGGEAAALSEGFEGETAEQMRMRLERKRAAMKACEFYEEIQSFLRSLPLPSEDSTLNSFDAYALKREHLASRAAAALIGLGRSPHATSVKTEEAAEGLPEEVEKQRILLADSTAAPVLQAAAARNPFVPPWLVHLLIGRSNENLSAAFKLRLAVQIHGIPFPKISKDALAEYEQLLRQSVNLPSEFNSIHSVPAEKLDDERVRESRRDFLIMQMHLDVALAAFKIPKLERKIAAISCKSFVDLREIQKLQKKLVVAYEGLAEKASYWKEKVEKDEIPLSEREARGLKTVLNQMGLLAFFSKRLVTAHAEAALNREAAERNRKHMELTSGLVAIAELQIAQATKGSLHAAGIVPLWWAHIR